MNLPTTVNYSPSPIRRISIEVRKNTKITNSSLLHGVGHYVIYDYRKQPSILQKSGDYGVYTEYVILELVVIIPFAIVGSVFRKHNVVKLLISTSQKRN